MKLGPGPSLNLTTLLLGRYRTSWLVISVASLGLYLGAFTFPFFLGKYYATPQLTWASMSGLRVETALAYTLVIGLLFGFYYLGYRLLASSPSVPAWAIYLPPALSAVALLAIYPPGGWDLFLYISQGRLHAVHNLNPFFVAPQDAPVDMFFQYSSWWPHPSTYGPAWQALASLLSLPGGDSLWLSMLVFKTAVTIFLFASAVVVYLILRRHRPETRHTGAFLLLWNPLLLFEIAGNGHNDIVMVFFALLAIYIVMEGRWLWALPLLTMSALVKYSYAIVAPGILLYMWQVAGGLRQRVNWILGGLALSGLALFLFARPFGAFISTSALFGLEELYRSSLASVLFLSLRGNFPDYQATSIVKWSVIVVLIGIYAVQFFRLTRQRPVTPESLLLFSFQAIFFFLLLVPRFHPWFAVWLMGLGVLMVGTEPQGRAVLLTVTAFVSHIVYYFGNGIYGDQLNYFTVEVLATGLVFGPPLYYWLWSRSKARRALLIEKEAMIVSQQEEIAQLRGLEQSHAGERAVASPAIQRRSGRRR